VKIDVTQEAYDVLNQLRVLQTSYSDVILDLLSSSVDADGRRGRLEEQLATKDQEIEKLRYYLKETLWMARRYAHNRSTYAPGMVNEAIQGALELGVKIEPDNDIGMYADDAGLGKWSPEHRQFVRPGVPLKARLEDE
jgi:predicted CopG family antitoxin